MSVPDVRPGPGSVRRLLFATLVAALLAAWCTNTSAAPIDDARARAAALQAQLDENGRRADALSEQLNGATLQMQQAEEKIAAATREIAATQMQLDVVLVLVRERATEAYRSAGRGSPIVPTGDVSTASARRAYERVLSRHDHALMAQLRALQARLEDQKADAERARAQVQEARDRIATAKASVDAATAQQQQLLAQAQGELKALVDAAEQQRRAQEAASAQALVRSQPSGSPSNTGPSGRPAPVGAPLPAPSGGAAGAIGFARAQLGKPYASGGVGPGSYDCSGLTMAAWAAAGVALPHYSGAQYSMLPKVSLGAAQPGDLIFWGPGGSDHVAIYLGNGTIIDAPHTGAVVSIRPIWGAPIGAARP